MNINPMVIDIFHGDDVESFQAAYQFGIRGVIHKATEGATDIDPTYAKRRPEAIAAGLLWGAYHFMRPGDPVAQADHFVETAAPDADTLVAVDHEDDRVPLFAAIMFMRRVEDLIGRQAVIYSGGLIKAQIRVGRGDLYLAGRRLWLAHYSATPTWPATWKAPWLHQFTGDGEGPRPHTVPGMKGDVDVNSFAGTADQLAAQWAGEAISGGEVG